jgi:uncharacterized protein YfaQ (DUF2300 family)
MANTQKLYTVTATLKFVGYTNFGCHDGYEVEVYAKNAKDAISQARRKVWDQGHDRQEGPLTYRAVVAEGGG